MFATCSCEFHYETTYQAALAYSKKCWAIVRLHWGQSSRQITCTRRQCLTKYSTSDHFPLPRQLVHHKSSSSFIAVSPDGGSSLRTWRPLRVFFRWPRNIWITRRQLLQPCSGREMQCAVSWPRAAFCLDVWSETRAFRCSCNLTTVGPSSFVRYRIAMIHGGRRKWPQRAAVDPTRSDPTYVRKPRSVMRAFSERQERHKDDIVTAFGTAYAHAQ